MKLIKKAFPFSFYDFKEKPLAQNLLQLYSDVLSVVDRRLTSQAFCKKYPSVELHALEEFVDSLDVTSLHKPLPEKEFKLFKERLKSLLSRSDSSGEVANAVFSKIFSYLVIQPLLEDDELEEIMINGANKPILVYHDKQGVCKTNLSFSSDELKLFLSQLNASLPFDDVSLSDASRANVTFPPCSVNPTITIRKFKKESFSVIDLVKSKTLSEELAAFLWTAFEGLSVFPLNVLIAGSTAAGKTTTLNALTAFIPPSERVISIEDVPELNLKDKENWIPLFISKKASAQDLLKNALRMRPDRLIVGDIRGGEAETLFTAMNTGHRGTSGTMHANNDRDALTRLEHEPMNVPRDLLPLVDLIVIQNRFVDRRKGMIRRVLQVSEVSRIEDVVSLNQLFKWDPVKDELVRTGTPSYAIEKLSRGTNNSITDVLQEIEDRKSLIEYLLKKSINRPNEVSNFMTKYYEKTLSGNYSG